MPRRKTRTPATLDREREIIDLRVAGLSQPEIGLRYGITRQRVQQIVDRGLARALTESADKLRAIELQRLERMTRALWPLALTGRANADEPIDRIGQDRAVLRLLQIADRRAKLLGLDAPIKVEMEDAEAAADRMAAELAAFQAGSDAAMAVLDADSVPTPLALASKNGAGSPESAGNMQQEQASSDQDD